MAGRAAPAHRPVSVIPHLACAAALPGYYERTMSAPYRASGHHDPAWDDSALALITAYEKTWASGAPALPPAELVRLGEAAIGAGCHDLDDHRKGRRFRQHARPVARAAYFFASGTGSSFALGATVSMFGVSSTVMRCRA